MEAKGIASEPTARNQASGTIQSARKAPVRLIPWHLNVWLRRAVALTGGLLVLLGLSALAGGAHEVWASARERSPVSAAGETGGSWRLSAAFVLHGPGQPHGRARGRFWRLLAILVCGAARNQQVHPRLRLRPCRIR